MKRIYIKPETELIAAMTASMLEGSTNTQWNTGTEGQNDDQPVGPEQPDPNAEAKQFFDLWDTWDTWE